MEHVPGMPEDYHDDVETTLCPRIAAIQRAPCDILVHETSLASLLRMRTLIATANTTRDVDFKTYASQDVFTGLYIPGVVHQPHELAALLVHLGKHEHLHGHAQPIRFVSTNSNNGWAACLFAAYLARTHAPASFQGLAVNGLKTEWATVRNVRVLLEKLNLSWRANEAFDATADAALMEYHPHVRNSLGPTAYAKAALLLPVSWVGLPPPFDLCFRMGEYDRVAVLEDIRALGGHCRELIYRGAASTDAGEVAAALASAHALAGASMAHGSVRQVGAFVVLSSTHLREATTHGDFHFVNKTPPAALDLYAPFCMQDMAGCNWHKGVPEVR